MSRTRLDKMVDAFAEKMKRRLRQKSRDGWSGWDEEWFDEDEIKERIYNQTHVEVTSSAVPKLMERKLIDPIDLANYCAFLDMKRADKE